VNPIRRVLLALDPAAPRTEVFDAIAALVDPANVEVTGLFVEDDALLRLSSLPFAVEIRRGGPPRALDAAALQAQLEERARTIRAAFEAAARSRHLRARFTVTRGEVVAELLRAAAEADVLVIGRSFRSAGVRTWLGAALERLGEAPPAAGPRSEPVLRTSLLFVHEPWAEGSRVLLLDDGSEAGAAARERAEGLARGEGLGLEVRRLGSEGEGPPPLLPPGEAPAPERGLAALRDLCRRLDVRVLVLPDTPALHGVLDVPALVRDLPASVILAR
jgi:hypothetical protein